MFGTRRQCSVIAVVVLEVLMNVVVGLLVIAAGTLQMRVAAVHF